MMPIKNINQEGDFSIRRWTPQSRESSLNFPIIKQMKIINCEKKLKKRKLDFLNKTIKPQEKTQIKLPIISPTFSTTHEYVKKIKAKLLERNQSVLNEKKIRDYENDYSSKSMNLSRSIFAYINKIDVPVIKKMMPIYKKYVFKFN